MRKPVWSKPGVMAAVLSLSLLGSGVSAFAAVADGGANAHNYTKALNLLEAKGYINFTNFHKVGNVFEATVTEKGKRITVTVNPDSGTVQTNS